MSVTHYENFPVASWLCPAHLRAPIVAIYGFARTADDLADEGQETAAQRLQALHDYRQDLKAIAAGQPPSQCWSAVFVPLAQALRAYALPVSLLHDLLSAFEQDVHATHERRTHPDRASLLAYCRLSANPVGRLLLHLYGVHEELALERSDAICSALQLINFWQDVSQDLSRQRHYVCDADCERFGVVRSVDLCAGQPANAAVRALMADNVAWARGLMLQGAPLIHAVRGRAAWELRLVIQGGLRVLERLERLDYDVLQHRPKLNKTDMALCLWRTLWM